MYFYSHFVSWQTFISIPEEDPVWSHAQRLTARAGSVFVWNQLVAHGSAPNNSTKARSVDSEDWIQFKLHLTDHYLTAYQLKGNSM